MVGAVLGCTLSVLSGGLNAVATCFYTDILENTFTEVATPEKMISRSRAVTLICGIITSLLAVLSTNMKIDIINFSNIVSGLFNGPVSAVFLLGMLTKFVNTTGIIAGFVCSILLIAYVLIGEMNCVYLFSSAKAPGACHGFLYYAQMNAWIVATFMAIPLAVIAVFVSYMTKRPSDAKLRNVTVFTLLQNEGTSTCASNTDVPKRN
jgi:Na+/proline symporter